MWTITCTSQGRPFSPPLQPFNHTVRLRGDNHLHFCPGVILADDHPVVRDGLAAMVNQQPDMEVVAEASDGEEAITLYEQHRPDAGPASGDRGDGSLSRG